MDTPLSYLCTIPVPHTLYILIYVQKYPCLLRKWARPRLMNFKKKFIGFSDIFIFFYWHVNKNVYGGILVKSFFLILQKINIELRRLIFFSFSFLNP